MRLRPNLISFDLTAKLDATAAQARPEAGTRRRRGHDQLPGPNPALRHARHHRRRNHPRQLRLPRHAGDASSAIGNFGYSAQASVELRIHPIDAGGTSRAAFYDTVKVGDRFDYQTNGIRCAFRFKVTSVAETASPKAFGIEFVNRYGGWCRDLVDDPEGRKAVQLRLGAPLRHPGRARIPRDVHPRSNTDRDPIALSTGCRSSSTCPLATSCFAIRR